MEPTSNPTETDIHTAKPADNEVQALEYNEATIVFDVALNTVEASGFQTLKIRKKKLLSTSKNEMLGIV